MQQNRSQRPRSDKIVSILTCPHNQFAERWMMYLKRKMEYFSLKNVRDVVIGPHIELLYAAKMKPEAFKLREVHQYFSEYMDSHQLPRAFATTLFMIFGHVYAHEVIPPVIMAKLLYSDVIGPNEFCSFQRAAELIRRIQLVYFYEPSLRSFEADLYLFQFSHPNSTQVDKNSLKIEERDLPELGNIQKSVDSTIMKFQQQKYEPDSIACMIFFFSMPKCRKMFLDQYVAFYQYIPTLIPLFIKGAEFFLSNANADDIRSSDFLVNLVRLDTSRFAEEFHQLFSVIEQKSPSYSSILINTRMRVNDNTTPSNNQQTIDSLINSLLTTPEEFQTRCIALNEQFAQIHPSFAYSSNLLTKFLSRAPQNPDGASRVCSIHLIVLQNTQFENDPTQLTGIITNYLNFIVRTSGQTIGDIIKHTFDIVVPKQFENTGLPLREDALAILISNPIFFKLAYHMICAAAKFQPTDKILRVIGQQETKIADYIKINCVTPAGGITTLRQSFVLASLLVIISPERVGANIWKSEKSHSSLHNIIINFLLDVVSKTDKVDSISFDEGLDKNINDLQATKTYILKFARLSFLKPEGFIRNKDPFYLDEILESTKVFPPPKWINIIPVEVLGNFSFIRLLKYIFIKFIDIAETYSGKPVTKIFTNEIITPFIDLIQKRKVTLTDKEDATNAYVEFLDNEEKSIRTSAYFLISCIHADKNGPKFKVGDSLANADIIEHAIYIDSEKPMILDYLKFIDTSRYAANKIEKLIRERPLLCNCLADKFNSINSRISKQNAIYDKSYSPSFIYPEYAPMNPPKRKADNHHHQIIIKSQPKIEILSELVIEPVLPDLLSKVSNQYFTPFSHSFDSTEIDNQLFRFEILFNQALPPKDNLYFYALSSLKRFVTTIPSAFLKFIIPNFEILKNEFEFSRITDTLIFKFICCLSLCRIRMISSLPYSDEDSSFIEHTLKPYLCDGLPDKDMILSDNPQLAALIYSIVGSPSSQYNLNKYLVPSQLVWEDLISHRNHWDSYIFTLLISPREYAAIWLEKISISGIPFDKQDIINTLVVPTILSCDSSVVCDFFATNRIYRYNDITRLQTNVNSIIAALYQPVL